MSARTEIDTMWMMTGKLDGTVPPNVVAVPHVYLDVSAHYRASEATLSAITAQRLKLDPHFTRALVRALRRSSDSVLAEGRA